MNEKEIEVLDIKSNEVDDTAINFSIIKAYGEDLTQKKYITNPAIARDDEIKKLIIVLLTPDKSGLLIGKAGIGKTAIVDGLAYKIQNNDVPDALKNYRIIKINSTSLLGKITKAGKHIKSIGYKNRVKATPEVMAAIENADLIIVGIGSLYTSIIPNLLPREMKKALKEAKAKKMYICNIMSEHGETDDFNVSDCVKQINKYVDKNFIDVVLANKKKVPDDILELYKVEEAKQIMLDKDEVKKMGVELISADLLSTENNQARHDYVKTALEVFTYLTKER